MKTAAGKATAEARRKGCLAMGTQWMWMFQTLTPK
jgi:hypothetical protein